MVKAHVYQNCHEFLLGGGHIPYFGESRVITRLPPSRISATIVIMNASSFTSMIPYRNTFLCISQHKDIVEGFLSILPTFRRSL